MGGGHSTPPTTPSPLSAVCVALPSRLVLATADILGTGSHPGVTAEAPLLAEAVSSPGGW